MESVLEDRSAQKSNMSSIKFQLPYVEKKRIKNLALQRKKSVMIKEDDSEAFIKLMPQRRGSEWNALSTLQQSSSSFATHSKVGDLNTITADGNLKRFYKIIQQPITDESFSLMQSEPESSLFERTIENFQSRTASQWKRQQENLDLQTSRNGRSLD